MTKQNAMAMGLALVLGPIGTLLAGELEQAKDGSGSRFLEGGQVGGVDTALAVPAQYPTDRRKSDLAVAQPTRTGQQAAPLSPSLAKVQPEQPGPKAIVGHTLQGVALGAVLGMMWGGPKSAAIGAVLGGVFYLGKALVGEKP